MAHEKFDINKQKLEPLRGIVKEVLFYKEETGYSVIVLETANESVHAAGSLPLIYVGASVCLYGVWYNHPKYGKQFTCAYYETKPVYNAAEAYSYLSGGFVKGVGAITAKKIVEKFGDATFDIIENDYDKLIEINGITAKKARMIHDEYVRKNEYQAILTFFAAHKIPPDIALKAYNVFGVMTIPVIKKNPFILWERIEKIHFFYVDKLAQQLGFGYDSPERVEAGIIYVLNLRAKQGNTCYPHSNLITEVMNLIHVSYKKAENGIIRLLSQNKIFYKNTYDDSFVMLPCYYEAELYIAKRTKMLAEKKHAITSVIDETLSKSAFKLTKTQKDAVKSALSRGITIITGGPGTGKTTIIRSVIECCKASGKKALLTAPTGRAAKRAAESAKCEASTIHRLLEVTGHDGDVITFAKNETNPLDCDVAIVDEMSMTDVVLFKSLLCALPENTIVILIGDANQLPPIGPGNVLRDLIFSNAIPCITLDKIFRQAENSDIVENAHKILGGYDDLIYNGENSDFFLLNSISSGDVYRKLEGLITKRLPEYLEIPSSKIQVITPLRKGVIGSVALNKVLKNILNPISDGEPYITHGEYTFSSGDRVMQIKNDYDLMWETPNGVSGRGIYNGDMGVITGVNPAGGNMSILFDDDKEVIYEFAKLENLELSYAITVHKSQGSEFDAVILPFIFQTNRFMNRNLLYTAVTRAKKFVCVLGKYEILKNMIHNKTVGKRYTFLGEFFKKRDEENKLG